MLMYRAKNERRISIRSLFTLWVKKNPTFLASQMKILVGLTCFHLFIPDLLIILEVFIVSFRLTLGKKNPSVLKTSLDLCFFVLTGIGQKGLFHFSPDTECP